MVKNVFLHSNYFQGFPVVIRIFQKQITKYMEQYVAHVT